MQVEYRLKWNYNSLLPTYFPLSYLHYDDDDDNDNDNETFPDDSKDYQIFSNVSKQVNIFPKNYSL